MTEQPPMFHGDNAALSEVVSPVEPRKLPGLTAGSILQAALEIGRAAEEIVIFDMVEAVLEDSVHECAVFDVSPDYIRLINPMKSAKKLKLHFMGTSIHTPGAPDVFTGQDCILLSPESVPEPFTRLMAFYNRLEFGSVAVFPIHNAKGPIRLIILGFSESEPPPEADLYLYSSLAALASQGLKRVQKHRSMESRLEGLETLSALNQTISVETDLVALYKLIHQQISARFGEDISFAIAIYHPNSQHIRIPYLYEGGKLTSLDPFPLGEGLTSYLLNNKKSLLLVRNVEEESRRLGAKLVGKSAKSWLGVPLILMGEALGAIIVQDTESEGRFVEKDRQFLETLAPQLAIAIRNAQLLDEMTLTLQKYDQERFLLNSLLENIPEKVYFKAAEGQYIRASKSWLEQLPPEQRGDVYGKTDLDLFPGEEGLAHHEWDMDIITTTTPAIGVIEEKTRNGETTWEWTSRIPLFDSAGAPAGLLGIAQDITDLKKTELLSRRRAQQLQTASEIARDTTGSLETHQILRNAVNLIRERFDYYHASVFLIDPTGRYAVLQEASGKVGETMKKIGHRLEVGSSSLVGRATAEAKPVVVNDTPSHPNYYPNPLLPETRSEIVVPLKIGSRVLGALDVQSNRINAFSPEDTHTLEILADQLSIALENANLFSKTQDQIAKQKLLRQLTLAASSASDLDEALQNIVASLNQSLEETRVSVYFTGVADTLEIRASAGYDYEHKPADQIKFGEGIIGNAASSRKPVLYLQNVAESTDFPNGSDIPSVLAVPILYLDDLLGVLTLESSRPMAFDETDQEMMSSLGDSIGVVIANIRLLIQIRNQMELQQKLFDISGKIRQSVDVETILRTTAQEIGATLGFSEVVVELISPDGGDPVSIPLEES
jgi:PAS domain S-box-containing protein